MLAKEMVLKKSVTSDGAIQKSYEALYWKTNKSEGRGDRKVISKPGAVL